MEEQSLLERLIEYSSQDYYPFHMPGHKRNSSVDYIPARIDITEIDGFDNLHHANGILREAQDRAAELYGASESFFLVNGSSGGILSAISACVTKDGKILMARNCHKAAYHAAYLRGLDVAYFYPEIVEEYGICGGITPSSVQKALEKEPDRNVVFLTSPTYEGMVSDIRKTADIIHEYQGILIVDEAHGAHLGIGGEAFPKSAIQLGADLVIQSLHKTLPSMTQTAILHVCGDRIDRSRLRRFLQMYQTSSPSYVFMAGIDSCVRLVEKSGSQLFPLFSKRLDAFYEQAERLRCLKVIQPSGMGNRDGIAAMDPSKICIMTTGSRMTGVQLYTELLETYRLQMEMAAGNYVLAMTSIMDTEEGFERLITALKEIDDELWRNKKECEGSCPDMLLLDRWIREPLPCADVAMRASETELCTGEIISFEKSAGRVSMEYRYVYPPGVPLLVPGEVITEPIVRRIMQYERLQLDVLGAEYGNDFIKVVSDGL